MTLIERLQERIKADEAERVMQEHGSGWYCDLCDDQETTFRSEAEVKHGELCPLGLLKEAEAVIAVVAPPSDVSFEFKPLGSAAAGYVQKL